MKLKTDKPEIYQMMGDYYKLCQVVYDCIDIKAIVDACDAFCNKWAVNAPDKQNYMAQGLVQGILTWKDEEGSNGAD